MQILRTIVAASGLVAAMCLIARPADFARADDWRQFRGNDSTGVADAETLPTSWDAKTGRNIAWSAELPGRGLSGPIVTGGRVFVTACTGVRQEVLHTLCFDAASGERLWGRRIWATGNTMCHNKMAVATPTPASDGQRVVAFYSSNDLVCYDLDGNFLWHRGLTADYPNASNSLGMSSSPAVVGNVVVVQVEADADAFAAGIDIRTGETVWKLERPRRASWTSPIVWQPPGRETPLVLLQGSRGIQAVDPQTGETIARALSGAATIPSTAVDATRAFVPSNGVTTLTLTSSSRPVFQEKWNEGRLGPATASAIVYRDRLYVVNRAGVLNCASTHNGEILWRLRLKGPFSATPVAADGKLYFFNEEGRGQVVAVAESGTLVGGGDLGDTVLATPAIADGGLFVRSESRLWKIAEKSAQ